MRILLCSLLLVCQAGWADSKFFANPELQALGPGAFALQQQNHPSLPVAYKMTVADGDKLATAIQSDETLRKALQQWQELSIDQQLPHLKRIFALECEVMGMTPPTLLIDDHSYPGRMVNFDFDPQNPSTGTVYLHPQKLAELGPYMALAFLLHETRHSFQFQQAFAKPPVIDQHLAEAFARAFTAQKNLTGKGLSFSDFLTLMNEYEAFMFGNYVLGRLTDWQLDTSKLGTFASQFDSNGNLKINLIALSQQGGELSLLERYNKLAQAQYQLRQKD